MSLRPTQSDEKRLLFLWIRHPSPCHPDRSAAQWRDLRFLSRVPHTPFALTLIHRLTPAAAARRFDVQDVPLAQVLAAFAG